MIQEAQRFWDAISGKVRQLIQSETQNTYRCERYEVTTAPNGSVIGVTLPMGENEVFLPYSSEVSGAAVGDPVMVVWWRSMSNAKVFYFADGYRGNPLASWPVGSYYWSSDSTSPAALFGGTWEAIEDVVLFAASTNYPEGTTGGEATHTLIVDEIPSHTHGLKLVSSAVSSGSNYSRVASSGTENADIIGYTGGGQPHNNMMPYMAGYCWHRVA